MGATAEGQDNGEPVAHYPAISLDTVQNPDPNQATTIQGPDFASAGDTTGPLPSSGGNLHPAQYALGTNRPD